MNEETFWPAPGTSALAQLHSDLLEMDVVATYHPVAEEGQVETLDIALGLDPQDRSLHIQAFVLNDVLQVAGAPEGENMIVLVLHTALPFAPAPEAAREIESALNLANHFSFLGSFVLAAGGDAIVLKYPLVAPVRRFNGGLVLEVLSALRSTLMDLLPSLEQVATGKATAVSFRRHLEEELGLQDPAPGARG